MCMFQRCCARFRDVVHVSEMLCTFLTSCARFTSPLMTFVFNCIHTERILISKSIGATKHVLIVLLICIYIYILYIYTYAYIYIYFQMVCQKLCQKGVSGWGSLEDSNWWVCDVLCNKWLVACNRNAGSQRKAIVEINPCKWDWCIILLGTNSEDVSAASHSRLFDFRFAADPRQINLSGACVTSKACIIRCKTHMRGSCELATFRVHHCQWKWGLPKSSVDLQCGKKWYCLVAVGMVAAIHFFMGTKR